MSLKHATIAANRYGLGATPGLIEEIRTDPQGWLIEQMQPREVPLPPPIAALPSTVDDLTAFSRVVAAARARMEDGGVDAKAMQGAGMSEEQRRAIMENMGSRRRDNAMAGGGDGGGEETGAMAGGMGGDNGLGILRRRNIHAAKARFDAAVQSRLPYRERLVHFWANHFVVSAAKGAAVAMPPSFQKDVARTHVSGMFLDMLTASSKHPAMLFYLDNYTSIGPNSKWGNNPDLVPFFSPVVGVPEGLNENLAREILELHTVGVNGGYTQEDVTNFARIITGWGVPPSDGGRVTRFRQMQDGELFHFNPDAKEPGAQVVMGKTYAEGGVDQGDAVLADLARHDKTAEFVATKLVRHFIADEPPEKAVKKLASVFRETGGDLREVSIALARLDEGWREPLAKMKRPEEFLISAVRAIDGPEMTDRELAGTLREMGQPTFYEPGPDGWPDVADAWFGPDPLWKRLEWASNASLKVASTEVDPAALGQDVLGAALSKDTLTTVRRAESPAQGLTLLLTSPEFHRR